MIETKTCRDANHEGINPLPLEEFYKSPCTDDGRQSYCKECFRARSALQKLGVTITEQRSLRESERFIERHEQRREKERELEATFERGYRGQDSNAGEMSFADIKFNSLDPEPVFRDLTNQLLRSGNANKVFGWKIGYSGR